MTAHTYIIVVGPRQADSTQIGDLVESSHGRWLVSDVHRGTCRLFLVPDTRRNRIKLWWKALWS